MTTEIFGIGSREQIAWVEEQGGYATLGTNTMVDDGEIVGYNAEMAPGLSQNFQEIENNGSDTAELISLEKGPKTNNFTLKFVPYDWKFLRYCTHPTVTNTNKTTYYEHVFSIANSVKTFTLEWARRQNTNQVVTFSGCTIKSYKLSWKKGTGQKDSFLVVEANCVAKSQALTTTETSLSYPTAESFKYYMSKFTYAGTEVTEVNSGEINFNNGISEENSRYANSTLDRELGEPIPTKKIYDFSMNVNQKDNTFYSDFDGEVVSGTHTITFTRAANDDITFTFTNLYIDGAIGPTNPEGVTTADIVGRPMSIGITANDGNSDY